MIRWSTMGLIVAAAFAFMILAVWVVLPHCDACGVILWPGAAIADSWLQIDFWQHPRAFGLVTMAFDVFIYIAVLASCLVLFGLLKRRVKTRR